MKTKPLWLLACFLLFCLTASAQFTSDNSLLRKALLKYDLDKNGFYVSRENVMEEEVYGITSIYAYDKHTRNLYVRTRNGNYVVTLNKEIANIFKKDKNIPQPTEERREALVRDVNRELTRFFTAKNDSIHEALLRKREQEIEDSIALEKIKLEQEARKKREQQERARRLYDYREYILPPHIVPLDDYVLTCAECDKHYQNRNMLCAAVKNDSVYFVSNVTKELGDSYGVMHVAPIPKVLKTDPNFVYHVMAYQDSLCKDTLLNRAILKAYNDEEESDHYQRVKKMAPYGYMADWGWGSDYGVVDFHFEYANLNSRTIKYIDVYWKITNDVNDLRCTGHFKGPGPLALYRTASWEWDTSSYFVAGDASNMKITKLILTYMNGSQKVLTASNIQFDDTDDYMDETDMASPVSGYVSDGHINDNDLVDTPACYQGGSLQLYDDLQKQLAYTPNYSDDSKQVYVVLKIEIRKDGTVGQIKVDESYDDTYDDIAVKAVRGLGPFMPARHRDQNVDVWFKLPVRFYL